MGQRGGGDAARGAGRDEARRSVGRCHAGRAGEYLPDYGASDDFEAEGRGADTQEEEGGVRWA